MIGLGVVPLVALVIAWALAEMVTVHPTAGASGTIAHSYLGRGPASSSAGTRLRGQ
jgi:hypothetical protein